MTKKENFQALLEEEYVNLFSNDPDYAYVKSKTTPKELAEKMTNGLITGSANKDGKAIKTVCKKLSIKHTYKEIKKELI